jgi:hypothetical protein
LRGVSPGARECKSNVQAIGEEGDEDVRLDARFVLMEDRSDREGTSSRCRSNAERRGARRGIILWRAPQCRVSDARPATAVPRAVACINVRYYSTTSRHEENLYFVGSGKRA